MENNDSPQSTSGADSLKSVTQTPNTWYSPDALSSTKYQSSAGLDSSLAQSPSDPFISTGLRATAVPFTPAPSASTPMSMTGTTSRPLPGTIEHLDHIIAADQAVQSPSKDNSSGDSIHFGVFTTETKMTRNLKVSSVYNKCAKAKFDEILRSIDKSGTKKLGTFREDVVGNNVYVRCSSISDAKMLFQAFSKLAEDLIVEYISASQVASVVSPKSKVIPSAHEGQVTVRVNYPPNVGDTSKFDECVRELLSNYGNLSAWIKVTATEAGILHLIVEFDDVSLSSRAIRALDGMSHDGVVLSVKKHTPDVTPAAFDARHHPISTPTRATGGDSKVFLQAVGSMSMSSPAANMTPYSRDLPPFAFGYPAGYGGLVTGNTGPPFNMGPVYSPSPAGQRRGPSPYGMSPLRNQPPSPMNVVSPTSSIHSSAVSDHVDEFEPGVGKTNMEILRQEWQTPTPSGFRPRYGGDLHARPSHRRQFAQQLEPFRRRSFNQKDTKLTLEILEGGQNPKATVMVRNIPNKMNHEQLKAFVDQTSWGKYDFIYLRIDFSNNCNVGYGFINFVKSEDIIPFYKARHGQRWEGFASQKIAEISYATMQGTEALINKFRNSSVLLESQHYRPKLYWTQYDFQSYDDDGTPVTDELADPRIGEEREFPSTNNTMKLKRSCDNAEMIGLFAPSAGQHLRDEQRRRHSNFDRGTLAASREEHAFEQGLLPAYRPARNPRYSPHKGQGFQRK